MKKTKNFSRLTAFLLSLILTLASIPMTVIAEDTLLAQDEATKINDQSNNQTLIEDMSKRDSFTKHYSTTDGTKYAVVFAEQVHYTDGETWHEVDNRVSLDSTGQRYVTANPVFLANFATNTSSEQLVSMSDGEYTLSWSVLFSQKNSDYSTMSINADATAQIIDTLQIASVPAQILNNGESAETKTLATIEQMGKATSALRYNGVYDNRVDLRYTVLHGKIEEDIILNSLGDFTSYTLEVDTDGLTAFAYDNGTVTFSDANGNVIFTIDAPWMMDANGEFSDSIEVELTQMGNTAYIFYTPDRAWLESFDRAYPVLIDPSVTTKNYVSNYVDTYVSEESDVPSTTKGTATTLKLGKSRGKYNCPYIKILNIPDLSDQNITITNATFNVWVAGHTSNSTTNLYEVTGNWNVDEITYSNQPTSRLLTSEELVCYDEEFQTLSKYEFDITQWMYNIHSYHAGFSGYFNSSSWNGFKLDFPTTLQGNILSIYSSECTTASYRPSLVIGYTYDHDEIFQDQAVYSFKLNTSISRYVTVSSNATDGKNVFLGTQSSSNPAYSCFFRLESVPGMDAFLIKTTFGESGQEEIVKFDYSSAYNEDTNDYASANVYLGSAPVDASQYAWRFEHISGDSYKIVSAVDPNIALTRQSNFPGSAAIGEVGAVGNIFAAPYISSAAQGWYIESSGITLSPAHQLLNGAEAITVSKNDIDLKFFLPIYSIGDTVTWSSTNSTVASIDSSGAVTINGEGSTSIRATVTYTDGDVTYYSREINSILVGAGTYFMRNNNSGKYANLSGTGLTSNNLNTTNNFKWVIEYNPAFPDYYRIKSLTDNSYLGVDSTNTTAIRTYAYTNDYTHWKIDRTSSGVYTLRCKMTEYNNMFLSTNSAGTLVQSDDNDPNSYWNLFEIGFISNTQLEGQGTTAWCWAASARMFAKNYSSNVTYTQGEAVIHVKGSEVEEGGSHEEAIKAINYYLSTDPNITISLQEVYNVYSKETLVRFLDEGHVIYTSLAHYEELIDEEKEDRGGHAILIVGYTIIDGNYRFLAYDPWNPNVGKRMLISYENLYNGHVVEPFSDDTKKNRTGLYLWTCSIVVNTSYSSQTVPWYFG